MAQRYQERISGTLINGIDIHLEVRYGWIGVRYLLCYR